MADSQAALSEEKISALVDDISRPLSAYFSGIQGLSFTVEKIVTKSAVNAEDHSGSLPKGRIALLFDGNRYRIDDKSGFGSAGEKNNTLVAFDGETYQRLLYGDLRLYIRKLKPGEPKPSEYFFRFVNPMLMPFEFLSPRLATSDLNDFELSELQDPHIWDQLKSRIVAASLQTADGGKKLIIDFSASREALTQKKSLYRVTFDPQRGMYPVEWERIDKDGNVIYKYEIEKLGSTRDPTGRTLLVPWIATKAFYGGTPRFPSQAQPISVAQYTIQNFQLNPTTVDQEEFTIDPGLARSIEDSNAQVVITVPN